MADLDVGRRLAAGVYLRAPMTGAVMALVSPEHGDGVVAPVYGDAVMAGARATAHYGKEGRAYVPVPVVDPVALARKLAGFGFAGITIDEEVPVFFLNRAGENDPGGPAGGLPTHVGIRAGGGWTILGADVPGDGAGEPVDGAEGPGDRAGRAVEVAMDELVPWHDFARLDPLTRQWMGEGPFPIHRPDAPLYEVRSPDGLVVRLDGADLLGPYVSTQGAITLFSERDLAESLLAYVRRGGPFRVARFEPGRRQVELIAGASAEACEIVEIVDLPARLERHLAEGGPFLDIGLNSPGHRFIEGYFFRGGDGWYLRTITGNWRIEAPFRLTPAKATPPKADTVNGGTR